MTKKAAVVLMSGGLDSTVLAAHMQAEGWEVSGLVVNYGQRHSREIQAARDVGNVLHVPVHLADLRAVAGLFAGSSQTSGDIAVPHGHYTDESMNATVVPNRNMVLLALAGALAVSQHAEVVAYAAHSGDHPIYPDCRPEFVEALNEAMVLGTAGDVHIVRPFVHWTKARIASRGQELAAPMHLTWSCYEGGKRHCGKCGTCVERREAFHLAGVPDPTLWAEEVVGA